ncbi:hypothetical protein [Moorena producens]|uniref:hypothetical protein n=1 Tax=Moorena producens TaxID=1155739 RepID=UPI00131480E4|nr:hypothetical protein [Moorena producens]
MQSLMGETTPVAHGGDPQDRTGSPRPRCIATPYSLFPVPCSLCYNKLDLYLSCQSYCQVFFQVCVRRCFICQVIGQDPN